jgi:hypothetical protein
MLCQRNKEGIDTTKTDRASKRKISTNREEFFQILKEFQEIKNKSDKPLRIYSCVNRRDIEKGIMNFKREQLEADYYNKKDRDRFYIDIKNRWISSLMKQNARAETLFLLDIDSEEDEQLARRIIADNRIEIVAEYSTKNGKHIITKPFNPSIMPRIDIKKDGMLLLDF